MGCHFAPKRMLSGTVSRLPSWGTALNAAWMELWAQLLLAEKFRAQPKSRGAQSRSPAGLSVRRRAQQWEQQASKSAYTGPPQLRLSFHRLPGGRGKAL